MNTDSSQEGLRWAFNQRRIGNCRVRGEDFQPWTFEMTFTDANRNGTERSENGKASAAIPFNLGGMNKHGERIPERDQMVNPKDNLSLIDRIRWVYFQFSLATCTYMLDPWERHLADFVFLSVFAMITYACCTYLPHYAMHLLTIFARIFVSPKSRFRSTPIVSVIEGGLFEIFSVLN
ncbi:hypothetical protein BV898_04043 [Hypsibius exemplaris]|uniref:Uncharacterized protein n=1 Tax=Hypsibius exemplaris TaxID=2072580 RepID=A0A1W0X4D8_HYPEX|nr:hypothetical protein BV898_04043 [Hypsibius exemplaris]